VSMRILNMVVVALLSFAHTMFAQELDPDPNRIFVTPLKWERVAGAPHNEKLRYAHGTLAIFYLEGVYAEVSASFIRSGGNHPIGLNLNEGFIVRLGTWKRLEDSEMVRVESREVVREKLVRMMDCQMTSSGRVCSPPAEPPLPGPLTTRTCQLERPSSIHIAETVVCRDLVVDHPKKALDLSDFPSIVRQLVSAQKKDDSTSTR
jgi:hypothetical protein